MVEEDKGSLERGIPRRPPNEGCPEAFDHGESISHDRPRRTGHSRFRRAPLGDSQPGARARLAARGGAVCEEPSLHAAGPTVCLVYPCRTRCATWSSRAGDGLDLLHRHDARAAALHSRRATVSSSRAILSLRGGGSSVGRAPGCGPGGRGFESRPPPLDLTKGPVAQWIEQRTSNPCALVRFQPGPSRFPDRRALPRGKAALRARLAPLSPLLRAARATQHCSTRIRGLSDASGNREAPWLRPTICASLSGGGVATRRGADVIRRLAPLSPLLRAARAHQHCSTRIRGLSDASGNRMWDGGSASRPS